MARRRDKRMDLSGSGVDWTGWEWLVEDEGL